MSFIIFEDVSYKYPRSRKFALEKINLSVTEGEFLAVMGENGSGKTTLCKLINGIIPHHHGGSLSGTVIVDGCKTRDSSVPELALKVGMVLDDPDAQLFTSTVRHEAAFGPENICLSPLEIEDRVNFALSAAGLDGFQDRLPAALSGGEKQRLSIAAALAMKGKVLVLDEPLCRLDPYGVTQIMSVLNDIKKKHGITVVMASHNSEMIAEYADRVCVLKHGRIAALDAAKNIFACRELPEENGIKPLNDNKISPQIFTECPAPRTPAVEINNFCFKYPDGAAVENINLTINDNDFIALIGNNGSGKTTLLKNITGLLRPSSGDIFIRGKNTKFLSVSEISGETGFVMQNPDTQLFTDSVFNEVAFALKNARKHGGNGKPRYKNRLSKTEIKNRAQEALYMVGLRDSGAFPHALSRSDRVKTVIACVLAMGPRIILFDEADAGSDYKTTLEIMNIVKNLHSNGYTVLFVTHNLSLAHEYARRLIQIDRNGVVFDKEQRTKNNE